MNETDLGRNCYLESSGTTTSVRAPGGVVKYSRGSPNLFHLPFHTVKLNYSRGLNPKNTLWFRFNPRVSRNMVIGSFANFSCVGIYSRANPSILLQNLLLFWSARQLPCQPHNYFTKLVIILVSEATLLCNLLNPLPTGCEYSTCNIFCCKPLYSFRRTNIFPSWPYSINLFINSIHLRL